ncbi:MAG: substrate-binding domain-containing protein [Nevskia sp.]|nr:substrate-binding domain-containing protein [Nevskia sp.]
MSFKLKSVTTASLVAAFIAPVALATTYAPVDPVPSTPSATLYGGGATLPAMAYVGKSWIELNSTTARSPANRLSDPADTGSLFGAFTAGVNTPKVITNVALAISSTTALPLAGAHYAVGDVLQLTGGSGSGQTLITVTSVKTTKTSTTGPITGFTLSQSEIYTALPTLPASGSGDATVDTTVGSTGTGARFTYTSGPAPGYAAYPAVSYCQTGSGGGRNMLEGTFTWKDPANGNAVTASDATGQCGDYGSNTTAANESSIVEGFSAATHYPQYAASDAPLAASDIVNFQGNTALAAQATETVQIPTVAASIAVGYQNAYAPKGFTLSEQQICGIFAGTITNWHTLNSVFPSQPITVVYRSDGSGTSFNFSNHLANVCPTALGPNGATATGPSFSVNQTFYGKGIAGTANANAPAGSIGSSGNGGVVGTLQSTAGTIGYVESYDVATRAALGGGKIGLAKVSLAQGNNPSNSNLPYVAFDPLTSFKPTYTLPTGAVLTDTVLNTDSNGNLLSPATLAIGSTGSPSTTAAPAHPGCMNLVIPSSIATPALTATGDYPSYPIVAVTYLMGYNTGNGADAVNLQALFAMPYIPATQRTSVTTVGSKTGFAWLLGFNPTKSVSGSKTIAQCITQ